MHAVMISTQSQPCYNYVWISVLGPRHLYQHENKSVRVDHVIDLLKGCTYTQHHCDRIVDMLNADSTTNHSDRTS